MLRRVVGAHAILALFWSHGACADGVAMYGQFAEAVEHYRVSDGRDVWLVNSWGSWVGFSGGESLSGGTKVLFRWEDPFRPDTGNGRVCARLCWIGVSGEAGSIRIGRLLPIYDDVSLPWYQIQSPGGHNPLALWANCGGTAGVPDGCFDAYLSNAVRLDTNIYAGFKASATVAIPAVPPTNDSRNNKVVSVGAEYRRGRLYLGLAHQRNDRVRVGGAEDEATTASASIALGRVFIGGGVERLIYRQAAGGDLHRDYAGVMLRYVAGAHTLWANYGVAASGEGTAPAATAVNAVQNLPHSGAVMWSVGYEYRFSRTFALYTYYNEINNDANGDYNISLNPFPALVPGESIADVALAVVKRF